MIRATLALAAALATLLLGFHLGTLAARPPLVGYICNGAAGPIYAWEESDFPPCLNITTTE